jgi:hypothetical protein
MFTKRSNIASQDEYYADSLLTKPTLTQSIFHNMAADFATPYVAARSLMDEDFAKKPEGQAVFSTLDAIRLENETPSIGAGQSLAGNAAGMVGFGLNPVTWFGGELGAGISKIIPTAVARVLPDAATIFMRKPIAQIITKPLGKYVPETYGKEMEALSLSLLGKKGLKTFGAFAGAGVPQGVLDNFNRDSGHINWGGVAREAGEMGAFGLAIGSIPFTFGVVRGKINRAISADITADIGYAKLNNALEKGHITKAEFEWYSDLLEYERDPSNKELEKRLKDNGSIIANENGHTANTVTNEALFHILEPEDIGNLQGAISDQLAGDIPEELNKSLTNFIMHNRLDLISSHANDLDGIRGYVDFINKKFGKKSEKIEQANKILDEHLHRAIKENMPFSQKKLFKYIKQSGFEASHIKNLSITIPENMVKYFKALENINKLERKVKEFERKGLPENKQTIKRIAELGKNLPKILTPKEELNHLREKLLSNKGLPKNFQTSVDYHRLLDLSKVWHNAKTLLDRVHLEHEYNRQAAFRDLANQVLKTTDANLPQLAKIDNVIDYLKKRIEGQLSKAEEMSEVNKKLDEYKRVPSDSEEILAEQNEQIKNTSAEESREDFIHSMDKQIEFKQSEGIFKDLIACVRGALNA